MASNVAGSSADADVHNSAGERKTLDFGACFLLAVPMMAHGKTLGLVAFSRARPFDGADVALAEELVSRTALKVDHASRYTHDHLLVESMQRGLLPQQLPEQNAVDAASRYLPAQTGAGGDWFDIIPLSGARVALVVGDVVGHGVHAAITMNQLRTTVRNFATSDSPPEELVSHLCDFVARLGIDESATCLYAVYDPTTRTCTFTRAGHPPPLLVLPDGSVRQPDPPPGLPLGLAYRPFETVEMTVPAGSKIVLYTDGLIEKRHQDLDVGIARLADVLAANAALPPDEMCEAVVDAMVDGHPADDIALLVAATRSTGADRYASWSVPRDPAAVAPVRNAVVAQIEEWNLPELTFATELIASELMTNAIRYTAGPVELRLILDQSLFCEVSDGSSTQPRMRRARDTDEGGRGLFLVAQLATCYGTRYTSNGKIIWSEQTLPGVIDWARC
ncbi:SpoIIE family protein phosphatase [Streptomyces sp. NPDC048231]|uniref:SpoIIE family protein phosphatase n=1 Tax=Streptomyces sp. NPDC048231 TaxID=3365519 RepID=UPI003717567A